MRSGGNGKDVVNADPLLAPETHGPFTELSGTAPLPHKIKRIRLSPRRMAGSLIHFFSLTINFPIKLVRSHSRLWRWGAKL